MNVRERRHPQTKRRRTHRDPPRLFRTRGRLARAMAVVCKRHVSAAVTEAGDVFAWGRVTTGYSDSAPPHTSLSQRAWAALGSLAPRACSCWLSGFATKQRWRMTGRSTPGATAVPAGSGMVTWAVGATVTRRRGWARNGSRVRPSSWCPAGKTTQWRSQQRAESGRVVRTVPASWGTATRQIGCRLRW